ncbi:MAG: DUF1730 domain-containing protein, partial [Bdellovibrio sp.]|nr:DUF1730 domain-containing protein [Bdellovibrio sp.]
MTNLYSLLSNEAKNLDFLTFGGVDIEITLKTYSSHYQKYTDWIAAGYAGEMHYLIKRQITREDPRKLFPEAKSIFCVAEKYSASEIAPNISQHKPYPKYARYLRGEDYHVRIKKKLEILMHNVTQSWNANHITPLKWKICIDTSALLERSWAMFAGLGWIGKNTILIHPKSGSFFLLAAVLINKPLELNPKPLPNYCGNCNRCITSCPTQAFVEKNILDARKCISYLTLEKKSSHDDYKNNSGTWIAGCDI